MLKKEKNIDVRGLGALWKVYMFFRLVKPMFFSRSMWVSEGDQDGREIFLSKCLHLRKNICLSACKD